MSVTRHARLRDQAQVALAHAADIGIEGRVGSIYAETCHFGSTLAF